MVDMTVIVLTKNEEKNIEKCIQSLRGVQKRIVVVDSYSTDRTKEICMQLRADFYENTFISHADQFNWALKNTNISTEWVMRLDADEELTEELVQEIDTRLNNMCEEVNGIFLRRRVVFLGRWIRHGGIYPIMVLKIFRNGKAYCEQKEMDEHIVLKEGKSAQFKFDLIDNNQKELEWWIHKHNWYSTKEVADYINYKSKSEEENTLKASLFGSASQRNRWLKNHLFLKTPLFKRAKWFFIYRYFLRMGFLDGKEGLIFHFLQGYWYRFLIDAKIFEYMKTGNFKNDNGDLK